MSGPMRGEAGRFQFGLAGPADDAALRRCMATIRMDGRIAVSFRREPSFFAACRLHGSGVQVIKCTEVASGRLVGLGSRATTMLHVDGRPRRLGTLADLRGLPAVRRGTLLARGYRFLRRLHEADPVPFYLSVIFEANAAALGSLLGARAGLPAYLPLGRILTPALHLDFARPPLPVEGVRFGRADAATLPRVLAFLRAQAPARQFSPLYGDADFAAGGRFADLAEDAFFIARDVAGEIVACLAAWDQSALRQTHVERYPPGLAMLRPFYNAASALSPLKPLPPPGGRLPFVYLCCIAVRDNDPRLFAGLLRFAHEALRRGPWHVAIAGLHERDPLAGALADYRRIDAAGLLFQVHYPGDGDLPPLDGRPITYEMALA